MKKEQLIDPFITFSVEEGENLKLIKPVEGITDNIRQNAYWISDKGRIFSTLKINDNENEAIELTKNITIDGYEQQALQNKEIDTYSTYKVSRLVLTYFGDKNPNDFSKYEANHLDYNRLNNNIDNLNWLTHEENIKYSECNRDKFSDDEIVDIYVRIVIKKEDPQKVADDYGKTRNTILDAAHGRKTYEEKFKELGLYYDKIHTLTEDEIKNIYKELLKDNKNIHELSLKFNVTEDIIKIIRRKGGRYKQYLTEFPDIETNMLKNRFTKEEALEVHKACISGKYTQNELCEMFDTTPMTIHDIKFCENSYEFLKSEFGIEPPKRQLNRFDNKTALKIYKLASEGYKSKEIQNMTGICVMAINNIKFCRGQYEFLTKPPYNLKPIEKDNPGLHRWGK